MDSFGIYKVSILLLVIVTSLVEGCERFEQKSSKFVIKQRQEYRRWWPELVNYHEYSTLYNYTICRNATLEIGKQLEVNNGLRENLKYILFLNSTIPTIPVGVFTSFTNATELYLNNSGVQSVHPGAFSGMIKLKELFLQDNEIEVLERGTLNYLSKLKILNLSQNRLRIIEENSFLGLLALEKIYLGGNFLVGENFEPFNSLNSLNLLDLSNNSFTNFNAKEFANLKNLQSLLLNKNKFKKLTFESFENATVLKFLDVSQNGVEKIDFSFLPENLLSLNFSDNKISVVKNWTGLRDIDEVDLRRNNIASIDSNIGSGIKMLYLSWNEIKLLNSSAFEKLETLIELDLGHNRISEIFPELFQNLPQLHSLQLNDNQIGFLPVGCFKNLNALRSLNLSQNVLTSLEFGTFAGLDSLEELSLGHNKLTAINENSFHMLEKLRILFLNNNLITSLNVEDLLQHLKNLKLVTLKSNHWSCNALFKVMKVFKEKSVQVSYGDSAKTANVFGIACQNEDSHGNAVKSTTESEKEISVTQKSDVVYSVVDTKEIVKFYEFFRADFKNSAFYKLFSDFTNSSFYKFFGGGFDNSSFVRYFNTILRNNTLFSDPIGDDVKNSGPSGGSGIQASLKDANYLEMFINQNNDLIRHFQTLSNRIIAFVTIMVTILLVIILLFLFICVKADERKNYNNYERPNNNFIQNQFELQ